MARSVKVAGPSGITDATLVLYQDDGTPTVVPLTEWPVADTGVYIGTGALPIVAVGYFDAVFASSGNGIALATYLHTYVSDDPDLALIVSDASHIVTSGETIDAIVNGELGLTVRQKTNQLIASHNEEVSG